MRHSNPAHLHMHAISLFKRCAINQLMPHFRSSPHSPQCYKAHHDHYKRLLKIPTTTSDRSPHHNHLNHSQRFNAFTTFTKALPRPHNKHYKPPQPELAPWTLTTVSEDAGGTEDITSRVFRHVT